MPGNLQPAAPTDTLPTGFYAAITEELRVEAFVNPYPDGSSDRAPIQTIPRRFFRCTRRVTASQYSALWSFFQAHLILPFWFYVPRETSPPFASAPTGATGRYAVVWDGAWSDQLMIGRSEVSFGLREVA
jgi:hypothetical protein